MTSLDLHFPGKFNLAKSLLMKAELTVDFEAEFPTNTCISVTVPGFGGKLVEVCEVEKFASPYKINMLPALLNYAAMISVNMDNIVLQLMSADDTYKSPDAWTPQKAKLAIDYTIDLEGNTQISFISR